jgi:hypothetical protein
MSNRHGSAPRSPAKEAAAMAELAQLVAVAVIIGGIALFILGHEHVIAEWLGVVLGAPVCAAGVLLLLRGYSRADAANEALKAERAAAALDMAPPLEEREWLD